jgi:hypothetical protein
MKQRNRIVGFALLSVLLTIITLLLFKFFRPSMEPVDIEHKIIFVSNHALKNFSDSIKVVDNQEMVKIASYLLSQIKEDRDKLLENDSYSNSLFSVDKDLFMQEEEEGYDYNSHVLNEFVGSPSAFIENRNYIYNLFFKRSCLYHYDYLWYTNYAINLPYKLYENYSHSLSKAIFEGEYADDNNLFIIVNVGVNEISEGRGENMEVNSYYSMTPEFASLVSKEIKGNLARYGTNPQLDNFLYCIDKVALGELSLLLQ